MDAAARIAKSFGDTAPDVTPADTAARVSQDETETPAAKDSEAVVPDGQAEPATPEEPDVTAAETLPALPSLKENQMAGDPAARQPLSIPPAARTRTTTPPPPSDSERATEIAARPDPEAEAEVIQDTADSEEDDEEEANSDEDTDSEDDKTEEDTADEDSDEDEEEEEGSIFDKDDVSEDNSLFAEEDDGAGDEEDERKVADDDEPSRTDDKKTAEATGEEETKEEEKGPFAKVLAKWSEFFGGAGTRGAVIVSQTLDPVAAAAVAEKPEDPRGEGPWQVTDVQVAGLSAPGQGELLQAFPPQAALDGVRLALGQSIRLGVLPRGRRDDPEFQRRCIEKKRRTVIFCIIPVDWPEELLEFFEVGTVMYDGAKAIVRYDDERATFYHALFDVKGFSKIVRYYRKKLGLPTESWVRRMVVMAAAPRPNPTVLWRSVEPATNLVTILEIRKFDDARGGFPDTRRGVVLLYHTWSSPIFPEISHLELMMVK